MVRLDRASERRVTLCLGTLCLALVIVIMVHLHQDVEYWQYLEDAVQSERDAREKWQAHAELVRAKSATEVSLASGGKCPKCPVCPDIHSPHKALAPSGGGDGDCDCPEAPECPPAEGVDGEGCPDPPPCEGGGGDGSGKECPPNEGCSFATAQQTSVGGSAVLPLEENGGVDFKVYVYDLPEEYNTRLKREQRRCINDQYGTEIRIHEDLLKSPMHTNKPEEAEFFFVPIYGECQLFRANQKEGKKGIDTTNRWFLSALDIIKNKHPWWNRTQGRDHVFVFAGARGPHIFRDWKRNIKKSIFMTPEGDRSLSEQFNTWKDIVIPGLDTDKKLVTGAMRKMDLPRGEIFAFFRGTIHNKGGQSYSKGIRIKMQDHEDFKRKDVIFSEPVRSCDRSCYREEMRKSTFCLCPRGWSPWTLRAYQAMMVGCIPVVIADEIEFPYENVYDWSKLTVKIAERDALNTIKILRKMTKEQIKEKQDAIDRVWKTVSWQSPTEPGDAFHMVMQELGRKRRRFKASSLTFWDVKDHA